MWDQSNLPELGWSKGELDAMFFEPDFKPGQSRNGGKY